MYLRESGSESEFDHGIIHRHPMGLHLSGLGATGQEDIDYDQFVVFLWNKIKKVNLVPFGDLKDYLPTITLDRLIPDIFELVLVQMFIQKTEKKIKKAADIDSEVTVRNLSDALVGAMIDEFLAAIADVIGADVANMLHNLTLLQVLGVDEPPPGFEIEMLFNPINAGYISFDTYGPSMGLIRKEVTKKLSNKVADFIIDVVKELTGYIPPPPQTEPEKENKAAIIMNETYDLMKARAEAAAGSTIIINEQDAIDALWQDYMVFLLQTINDLRAKVAIPYDIAYAMILSKGQQFLVEAVRKVKSEQMIHRSYETIWAPQEIDEGYGMTRVAGAIKIDKGVSPTTVAVGGGLALLALKFLL